MSARALASQKIEFIIEAKNMTQRAFSTVSKAFPTIAKAGAIAAATITAAFAATGKAIVDILQYFAPYESALIDMGRVTDESFEEIQKKIMDLPDELGTATELVKGYYQVISSGVTDPIKAMEMLNVAAMAAKATHIDQSETIKVLTSLMEGFGDEIKSVTDASDLLFKTEKVAKTSFAELVPVMGSAAATAKELGVSAEELTGVLAQTTLQGGGTAAAMTKVESAMYSLMAPNTEMQKAFKDLNMESGKALVSQEGFAGALQKVREYAESAGISIKTLTGRKEAMNAVLAVTGEKLSKTNEKIQEMRERAGATQKAFDDWKGTLEAVWDAFKSRIGKIAIEIGDKIAPGVKEGTDKITKYLKDNKDEIIDWAKTFIEKVKEMLPSVDDFIKGLKLAMEAAVLLGDWILWLGGKFVDLGVFIGETAAKIVLKFEEVGKAAEAQQGSVIGFTDNIILAFENLWEGLEGREAKGGGFSFWNKFGKLFNWLTYDVIEPAINVIIDMFEFFWTTIKTVLPLIYEQIKSFVTGVEPQFETLKESTKGVGQGLIVNITTEIRESKPELESVIDSGIVKPMEEGAQNVIDAVGKMSDDWQNSFKNMSGWGDEIKKALDAGKIKYEIALDENIKKPAAELPEWMMNIGKESGTNILTELDDALRNNAELPERAITEIMDKMIKAMEIDPVAAKAIGEGMINSINSGIEVSAPLLEQTILQVMQERIDDYLPHSPAKKGPLANLGNVGSGLINSIAQGIMDTAPALSSAVSEALDEVLKAFESVSDIEITVNTDKAVEELKAINDKIAELPNPVMLYMDLDITEFLAKVEKAKAELDAKLPEYTIKYLNLDIDNFMTGVSTALKAINQIPKDVTTELHIIIQNALSNIQLVKDMLESIPFNTVKYLTIDIGESLKTLNQLKASIDEIPDTIYKRLILDVQTKASPVRPFTEGMDYINKRLENLPGGHDFIINIDKGYKKPLTDAEIIAGDVGPRRRKVEPWETDIGIHRKVPDPREGDVGTYVRPDPRATDVGRNITVNIQTKLDVGNVSDPKELAKKLDDELYQKIITGRSKAAKAIKKVYLN